MIGILSDSHDNADAIRSAAETFRKKGCSLVIHAGDIIAPFAARELQSCGCPVRAVFGNCDGEKHGLTRTFEDFGEIREAPFSFHHQRLDILVTHTPFSLPRYIRENKPDILIFGHTHRPEIRREDRTMVINPGEAGGWVTGKSTVAILDPDSRSVEIINL